MPKTAKKKSKKAGRRRTLSLATVRTNYEAECCQNSSVILGLAHQSAGSLLAAYQLARDQRGGHRGMTTDEEQDLLRAMLVMATAGLDALSKQLIRDSLPALIKVSAQAQNSFEKFIGRRLNDEKGSVDRASASKFLARVLAKPSPQEQLIEEYILDLTKGSLQSSDALFQVSGALGVDPPSAGIDPNVLSPIFAIRNSIIHELDVNLTAGRRNRCVRGQTSMIDNANAILRVSEALLEQVDNIVSSGHV